jgi:deazaflavin-dependent oxidoreductase (nitroreductase family)
MRFVNPLVSAILRSPFHRILSKSVLLLMVMGRRSGRHYTTPVGYVREGDAVTVFSTGHRWCNNLRGGAAVAILLDGRERIGSAELIEDPARVLDEVQRHLARYGARDGGRQIGLALDDQNPPMPEHLAAALVGHVVIHISLEPVSER